MGNEQIANSKQGLDDLFAAREYVNDVADLFVWQKARELNRQIYIATQSYPDTEKFGLVSQMRRASVSVASNIAEGFGRFGARDKKRFYEIANGSLVELKTQVVLSMDVGCIEMGTVEELTALIDETRKLLIGLIKSTQANV